MFAGAASPTSLGFQGTTRPLKKNPSGPTGLSSAAWAGYIKGLHSTDVARGTFAGTLLFCFRRIGPYLCAAFYHGDGWEWGPSWVVLGKVMQCELIW